MTMPKPTHTRETIYVLVDTPEKCKRAYEILSGSKERMFVSTEPALRDGIVGAYFLHFNGDIWIRDSTFDGIEISLDALAEMLGGKGEDKISAIDILKRGNEGHNTRNILDNLDEKEILEIMQEYADQQTSALRKENEKLREVLKFIQMDNYCNENTRAVIKNYGQKHKLNIAFNPTT